MRGLKLRKRIRFIDETGVASFTDAWIETTVKVKHRKKPIVASFTDAWIETFDRFKEEYVIQSHLLQMRGLKP